MLKIKTSPKSVRSIQLQKQIKEEKGGEKTPCDPLKSKINQSENREYSKEYTQHKESKPEAKKRVKVIKK